jgi:hypothetical protein
MEVGGGWLTLRFFFCGEGTRPRAEATAAWWQCNLYASFLKKEKIYTRAVPVRCSHHPCPSLIQVFSIFGSAPCSTAADRERSIITPEPRGRESSPTRTRNHKRDHHQASSRHPFSSGMHEHDADGDLPPESMLRRRSLNSSSSGDRRAEHASPGAFRLCPGCLSRRRSPHRRRARATPDHSFTRSLADEPRLPCGCAHVVCACALAVLSPSDSDHILLILHNRPCLSGVDAGCLPTFSLRGGGVRTSTRFFPEPKGWGWGSKDRNAAADAMGAMRSRSSAASAGPQVAVSGAFFPSSSSLVRGCPLFRQVGLRKAGRGGEQPPRYCYRCGPTTTRPLPLPTRATCSAST